MGVTITLAVICILLIIILTGVEYAYLASNKLTIELKRKQGHTSGKILGSFFDNPEKFWSATVIGFYISLVCFCLFFSKLTSILEDKYISKSGFYFKVDNFQNPIFYLHLIIDFILATFIILGSIGVIAKRGFEFYPEAKLNTWSKFINLVCDVTAPFANIFVGVSEFILKYLFNVRINKKESIFERTNTVQFLKQATHGNAVDWDESNKELFDRALDLTKIKVRKCMTPRNEITAADIKTSIKDLRNLFVDTKLSKIVIYDETLDNVVGYTHHLDLNRRPNGIQEILHPIPTVPETMSAIDLMHKFTKERKSIGWVVDEFGGTAGFVTMEDVLEEVFGDIKDEYGTQEYTEKQINDSEYLFSGRLEVDYLNEKYELELPADEAETLSGLIISSHEKIPKQKERIIIDNYEFEIMLVTDTRIEQVKLKILSH
ncbi:HlyC/CorC family transporter [Taibaiella lutea]|uniref:HlyC/CorC family transporter n=1 Tax=Taibaiella lutea TaxID=2608001 RepID=A0A5M6CI78_9BACT|nr:hemolysin family protein [Taibaiella lutea]KAA5534908.1 HlyC/CorC family transporter [Taibaiella lutea]